MNLHGVDMGTITSERTSLLMTLQKTAQLFRAFGEEYHERKMEEA